MQLSEKAAYVKGLIEGLELDPKDKQTKVFKVIADLLADMAEEIKELGQCYDDVCDQVDGISEDLAGVEDLIGDESLGSVCYDNTAVSSSDMAYEVTCPTCNETTYLNEDSLNAGVIKCPACGEVLELGYVEDELDDADDSDDSEQQSVE